MAGERYRRFGVYLRQRFGGAVRKISLDAGFTCPNRDGRLSHEGCLFCQPPSFAPADPRLPLAEQLRQGIAAGRRRGVERFIAYFQAYTNTYAPPEILRQTYDVIRAFPEVKALAIGTRPDCVDEAVLEVVAAYSRDYEVWLEYGLQSAHDATLAAIRRGHTVRDFEQAVTLARRYPEIKICGHVILGLPGETLESEADTAAAVAAWRLEGVKLHPLHVVRGTGLEQRYRTQGYQPLSLETYAARVVAFLERLWPETIIQRLTADCPAPWLVAPGWLADKPAVLRAIESCLQARDSWQGKLFA